ncbi:MAG: hemerythrin domain-containing protein [Reyranella sp.]|uniref:hemerythrin domain-containing protein n=1 Tax=Reyranella sp. TaxID=1929291 RepID=UPI001ACA45F4|nr:hemerythrin domain-containing protein [Reyranella sp.]MBN9091528.1 hemerythrin domain-containing protein [Reyranella sp.]
MDVTLGTRRRRLIGTAGALLLATPALAQQANPTKTKATEGGITATERLMRDSGLLLRILAIYDAGGRRLGGGEDIEPTIFTQAAETMRDFVHGYHEKQQDEYVFARFKKSGRMVELIDVLQAQHAAGRKLTDRILELAPRSATKNERQAMIEAMQASSVLYRPHVARELTDVWPALRTLLTPNEFDELGTILEKDEVEKLGKDSFDKMAKKVEALEKRIGINDISQFTPKS